MVSLLGGRPPARRRLTHGLTFAAALATAGIVGALLLGLPATASGKSKSKTVKSKKVTQAASQSSRKSTSPSPDYKSRPRKKDPPPNGGRPPNYKGRRPIRPKDPPTRPPRPKPPRENPRVLPGPPRRPPPRPPAPPPIIIHPILVVEEYPEVYYEDEYQSQMDVELTSLIFASTTLAVNYAFISSGEVNEWAAGAGILFGLTTLAVAAHPDSRYSFIEYLVGGAAIAFSVWNLSGGMDDSYEAEAAYKSDPYLSTSASGQTLGWTYSF